MIDRTSPIAVAGAGSVGCFLGGWLAAHGRDVTLLARDRIAAPIRAGGLELTDLQGRIKRVAADRIRVETHPAAALKDARAILLTVKSGDTEAMAELIRAHAREDAIVVSLQNGVGNMQTLDKMLSRERLVPGMVPFNVTQTIEDGMVPRFHRGTSGGLHIAKGQADGLAALLACGGLVVSEHEDMRPIAWSKLVLNLNNALNALSGRPLHDQLSDRASRRELAGQMDEAMAIIKASGVNLARIEGVDPAIVPRVLRLPTWAFRMVARRMMAIDRQARSSMAEDLERGRRTEIDYLQGAVVSAAEKMGKDAPKCREVMRRVKERESQRTSR